MQGPARVRPAADRPASCQAGQPLSADPLTFPKTPSRPVGVVQAAGGG